MTAKASLLTDFTAGVINTAADRVYVLRDEPTLKRINIDLISKRADVNYTLDEEPESGITTLTVHLFANQDTLRKTEGFSDDEATSFAFTFHNPTGEGCWELFVDSARYTVRIVAIWIGQD